MWYLTLYGIFALWVLWDGFGRKMGAGTVLWGAGTFILGPIVLPVYLAKRPLKSGEVREGGTGWNVLKNFAILWTIVMAVASIVGLMAVSQATVGLKSDAERAGAGIGMVLGMGLLAAVWFFPTMGAALLGFLLKKNSIVEKGPTGPLVGQESQAGAVSGWVGLVGVAVLGLILAASVEKVAKDRSGSSSTLTVTTTGTASAVTQPSTPSPELGGKWSVTEDTNEMDGTKRIALHLDAENEISGYIGKHTPTLIIRCIKKETDVFVNVRMQVQSNWEYRTSKVRTKFDDAAPSAQWWNAAQGGDALFAPQAVSFAKKLARSKTFMFEFSPFQRTEETVTFDVRGLDKHLGKIASACGWQFDPSSIDKQAGGR